jgi:serine/threonine-protein kinase
MIDPSMPADLVTAAPSGPDLDRVNAAVRAQLLRAAVTLHDDDVIAERYRLLGRVGRGSTATVWRARDERDGSIVALKLLRSRDLFAGTGVQRMFREAKLAGSLDHTNIVRVLDCGEYGDKAYVAMELVEGRSLAEVIAKDGPMPWPKARAVFLQIADALAAAHGKGVVHRDLKPANILVTDGPEGPVCKVIDFGLARPTGVDPSTGRLTGTGLVFGTPRYMSPEHVRGETLDARADVYALGCLMYEVLTGVPAVSADTIAQVLLEHLYRHPRAFAEVAPSVEVPPGAEALVRRATRKAPELRFVDMAAVRDAVLAVDRAELIDVPDEALEPSPMPTRRNALPTRMIFGLALVGVGTIAAWQVLT